MSKREEKDRKGYPLAPRQVGDRSWFYEQPNGIHFVRQSSDATTTDVISWRRLEAAVDNHRRAKRVSTAKRK